MNDITRATTAQRVLDRWSPWRSALHLSATAVAVVALAATVRLELAFRSQRVHVRYDTSITDAARGIVETQLGLADGVTFEPGTWSYRPQQRSSDDVQAIVRHPLVRDTHHIDRDRYLIALDRPDLPAWARRLAETRWTHWLAGILAVTAAVLLWIARGLLHRACRAAGNRVVALFRDPPGPGTHRAVLGAAAVALALMLPLAVESRPDEDMFVHLYEVPSLLLGDHPYRDFFEWGAPLPALLSTMAQQLTGYRLIGELLLQWTLLGAGVLIGLHMALRHTQNTGAVLAVLPLVILLGIRGEYHFSKILCIPLSIWLAWRYIDAPTRGRAAVMGVFTVVVFLARHDYAFWGALASGMALIAAAMLPERQTGRFRDRFAPRLATYAVAILITLIPWVILVSSGDGLPSYIATRAERFRYGRGSGNINAYRTIADIDVLSLRPVTLAGPQSGSISFRWDPGIDEERVAQLEASYGLHRIGDPASERSRYDVANVNDLQLLTLREYIRDDTGVNWAMLNDAARGVPSQNAVVQWLARMTMIVSIALTLSGMRQAWPKRLAAPGAQARGAERTIAGLVLCGASATLLREWEYFMVVGPLAAALSSVFLTPRTQESPRSAAAAAWHILVFATAASLLVLSTYAAAHWQRPVWRGTVTETLQQLQRTMRAWTTAESAGNNSTYIYIRECTNPDDRLLITGSTPYYIPYYTHRAMAGGHLDWSLGLMATPDDEARSLALLQRQSVPLIVGRSNNVLDEFNGTPRIRAYLAQHFVPVPGSGGSLFYDKRRAILRTYGPDRFPCFRDPPPRGQTGR